jgi:two-component system, sensor histidine kinase
VSGLFDSRFARSTRQALTLCPMRVVIALIAWFVLTLAVDRAAATLWIGAVLAAEVGYCASAKLFETRRTRRHGWLFTCAHGLSACAWSIVGILLWRTGSPACEIAAVAFFAGHLLYIQAHHGSSPALVGASASALVAPFIVVAQPRYAGPDQMVLAIAVAACAGNAVIGFYMSLKSSRALVRTAETLRSMRDEAEAANRAKSAFLATMSHEIRTPLNGVLGMAQAIGRDPALPAHLRERIDVISESGGAVLAIVSDVLDLSRIEAGGLELEDVAFDLEALVRTASATFRSLADAKGLVLRASADAVRGTWRGDPLRIRQILTNLVSNALKFTAAGEISVTARPAADGCALLVSDTGVGIAPAKQARIFDRFTQADESVTREHGGAGLGLAICRELAERMGGRIEVRSAVGEGTEFEVWLPIARTGDAAPETAPEAAPAPDPGRRLRVLAAEDNEINQLVLKALLAHAGVDVALVGDGRQAVDAWATGGWDLVLMDVQMPVMDGLSAAREIRATELRQGLPRTPIVALTANAMSHHVGECRAAGMDDFVAKPISVRDLCAAIERQSRAPAAMAALAARA